MTPPPLPPAVPLRSLVVGAGILAAVATAFAGWALRNGPGPRELPVISVGPTHSPPPPAPPSLVSLSAPEPTPPPSSLPPTDPASDARLRALLAMSDPRDVGSTPSPPPPPRPTAQPGPPDVATTTAAPRLVHVIVYSTSWCPACRAAKTWLQQNRVSYEDRDIEANRSYAAQMRSLNPRGSIPTIDVEGDVNVGFSSSWLVAMLQKHGTARN